MRTLDLPINHRRAILPAILFCAVLLFAAPASAQTLDDGNRAFSEGKYQASTQAFQAVLAKDGYSAPVLFDLGNSYLRQGDFARAILAYKRAQWLSPSDPAIAANLEVAQNRAGLGVANPHWNERLTSFLSATSWAWIACGAWTFLCACLLARAVWPARRALFFGLGTVGTFVLIGAILATVSSSREIRQAVVVDKTASALISPFPAAQATFFPAAGETVWVQKKYHDFYFVKDGAGHSGWMSKAQIEPVVSSGSPVNAG